MGKQTFIDYTCPTDGTILSTEVTGGTPEYVPEAVVCTAHRDHVAAGEGRPAYLEVCNQVAIRTVRVEARPDPAPTAAPVATTAPTLPASDLGAATPDAPAPAEPAAPTA